MKTIEALQYQGNIHPLVIREMFHSAKIMRGHQSLARAHHGAHAEWREAEALIDRELQNSWACSLKDWNNCLGGRIGTAAEAGGDLRSGGAATIGVARTGDQYCKNRSPSLPPPCLATHFCGLFTGISRASVMTPASTGSAKPAKKRGTCG